jgi:hypothetical protein
LGCGYNLRSSYSNRDIIVAQSINAETYKVVIPGHITDIAINSRYILASQSPRDSVSEASYDIPGMTLRAHDRAFKASKFRQYWILEKESGQLFGPIKKNNFDAIIIRLNIPPTLTLKSVEMFIKEHKQSKALQN